MKKYKEISEEYSAEEIAESFVFPGSTDKTHRQAQLEGFRAFRKNAVSKLTGTDKLINLLLQLRFQIEDYLQSDNADKVRNFAFFLKEYISRLDIKNKDFADEINVNPTELSLIINGHRPPSEKLMIRLEIHSNNNFPAVMWLKILEKERAFELVNDLQLREEEEKYVTKKLKFSLF